MENSLATIPEDCLCELKAEDRENVSVSLMNSSEIGILVDCLRYSSLTKLVRVTGYVLKFIRNLKRGHTPTTEGSCALSTDDVNDGLRYWLKKLQLILIEMKEFELWKQQFGLFKDSDGLWRCHGHLSNAELPSSAKHPILLPKDHHVIKLIILDCHFRVMHSGTKATLTELNSRYWIISERQTVRKLLYGCTVCRRYQGKPYKSPEALPLPSFRVLEALPFSVSEIDYAGPLYVQSEAPSRLQKVWMCLFTCCVTHGVHLEIVPDMTAEAFIFCFRRFTSRRGFQCRIVTDNAKTFKAEAKTLEAVLKHPEVKCFFSHINVKWTFNLESAPWWGGVFERMVQTTKRCLRKTIGSAPLNYDELLTTITEAEMIVNSRPLLYISSDDLEEPLTPSHLLIGDRVLSLPDTLMSLDDDLGYELTHQDLSR